MSFESLLNPDRERDKSSVMVVGCQHDVQAQRAIASTS